MAPSSTVVDFTRYRAERQQARRRAELPKPRFVYARPLTPWPAFMPTQGAFWPAAVPAQPWRVANRSEH